MQKKAAKKSKLLAEKQAEADEALKAITESMSVGFFHCLWVRKLEFQGAEDQKMSMEQLKAATEKENVVIEEKKAKIDEQLKEVQPLIDVSCENSKQRIQEHKYFIYTFKPVTCFKLNIMSRKYTKM